MPPDDALPLVRLLRVVGAVQGVGYRWWCVSEARALRLTGFVRNRRDGTVEALLQGPAEAVTRMEALLRQGPPAARVLCVTPLPAPAFVALTGFDQAPTI